MVSEWIKRNIVKIILGVISALFTAAITLWAVYISRSFELEDEWNKTMTDLGLLMATMEDYADRFDVEHPMLCEKDIPEMASPVEIMIEDIEKPNQYKDGALGYFMPNWFDYYKRLQNSVNSRNKLICAKYGCLNDLTVSNLSDEEKNEIIYANIGVCEAFLRRPMGEIFEQTEKSLPIDELEVAITELIKEGGERNYDLYDPRFDIPRLWARTTEIKVIYEKLRTTLQAIKQIEKEHEEYFSMCGSSLDAILLDTTLLNFDSKHPTTNTYLHHMLWSRKVFHIDVEKIESILNWYPSYLAVLKNREKFILETFGKNEEGNITSSEVSNATDKDKEGLVERNKKLCEKILGRPESVNNEEFENFKDFREVYCKIQGPNHMSACSLDEI